MARIFFLLLCFSFAMKTAASAGDDCCGKSSFLLGPQVYYGKLHVENTDSQLAGLIGLDASDADPKGWMYGVNCGYSYERPWGFYADIDINYGQGNLKGDDALTRYLHEYDATATFGYQVGGMFRDCWSFTPYIGIGYSTQYYNLTSFHVTYRFNVVHIPLGFIGTYSFNALCGRWSIGLNTAVMPQVDAQTKINLLRGAYWSLAKRSDWLVSIPIEYCNRAFPFPVKLQLFWKKTGYGGSKAVSSSGQALGLPPAKWNALGASLDLAWQF